MRLRPSNATCRARRRAPRRCGCFVARIGGAPAVPPRRSAAPKRLWRRLRCRGDERAVSLPAQALRASSPGGAIAAARRPQARPLPARQAPPRVSGSRGSRSIAAAGSRRRARAAALLPRVRLVPPAALARGARPPLLLAAAPARQEQLEVGGRLLIVGIDAQCRSEC